MKIVNSSVRLNRNEIELILKAFIMSGQVGYRLQKSTTINPCYGCVCNTSGECDKGLYDKLAIDSNFDKGLDCNDYNCKFYFKYLDN